MKHTHATVVLTKDDATLVRDPGTYTPESAALVGATTAVLVTHDHPDHFDAAVLRAALDAQPALRVWAPENVAEMLGSHDGRVVAVAAGDCFEAAGFAVAVFGERHAAVHAGLPPMGNVAYLIDGNVYHPGDSCFGPDTAVETLLGPAAGPWTKVGEGADFVRAAQPSRSIRIHDLTLSEIDAASFAQFTGELTGVPLTVLGIGESVMV